MSWLLYGWLFLKASLFSTGGYGNLPSLRADMLARHWATERQFAEALTIGQISPGPNGLWVISLGYLTGGMPGSFFALLGVTLPPLLVLAIERVYRGVQDRPVVEGFVRGLGLSVVGLFLVAMTGIARSAPASWHSLFIALLAMGMFLGRRFSVIVIIALAAALGVCLGTP
jgi:chromate transporter